METKAALPVTTLAAGATALTETYFEIVHLKQLFRQGWLGSGVPRERCESVAEHSFGVALLSLFLAEEHFPDLDSGKILRLALLHDLGEVYAGDLTPADGVEAEEKAALEHQAVRRILGKLPGGERYIALWEEYEAGETPEARFVREVDRLEMAFQASVYEHQGESGMGEFFASAARQVRSPALREALDRLTGLRGADASPPAGKR